MDEKNKKSLDEWISVKDSLPFGEMKVLMHLWDENNNYPPIYAIGNFEEEYWKRHDKIWFRCDGGSLVSHCTHWMPLPSMPSEIASKYMEKS